MATSALPKIWQICTKDELRVVRITAAGIILSDATVSPTLFDHDTAKKVQETLTGIMGSGGQLVSLMVKSKNLNEERK